MATEPLASLTDPKLLTYLDSIKDMFLTISILTERYRVSYTNKRECMQNIPILFAQQVMKISYFSTGIRKLDHQMSSKCSFTVQQTAK